MPRNNHFEVEDAGANVIDVQDVTVIQADENNDLEPQQENGILLPSHLRDLYYLDFNAFSINH